MSELRIGTAGRTAAMRALDEHLEQGRLTPDEYGEQSALAVNALGAAVAAAAAPHLRHRYDTFTADLHTLLEHLDLTDAALVGFSMGGGEVVRYLAQHGASGRVTCAVLAAAVPPYLHKCDDNPDGGLDEATIEAFRAGVLGDRLKFLDGFTRDFFSSGTSLTGKKVLVSEPQRHYVLSIAAGASPKGTLDCITAFGRTDFRADLAAVTVPALVIHGDSDQIVPFEVSGKRSAEAIPGARLVVVEGGPHGLNVTHKAEFNAALLDFLGG